MTLQHIGVKLMGRQLTGSNLFPHLKAGVTYAVLQIGGKTPVLNEVEIMRNSGAAIDIIFQIFQIFLNNIRRNANIAGRCHNFVNIDGGLTTNTFDKTSGNKFTDFSLQKKN